MKTIINTIIKDLYLIEDQQNIKFKQCEIKGIDARKINLTNLIFEDCKIKDCVFSSTNIQDCKFKNCKFLSNFVQFSRITSNEFTQNAFNDCSFFSSKFQSNFFCNAGFTYANLSGTNFKHDIFENSVFLNTATSHSNVMDFASNFSGCGGDACDYPRLDKGHQDNYYKENKQLDEHIFPTIPKQRKTIQNEDFSGRKITKDLSNTLFTNCNFSESSLPEKTINNSMFENCIITDANLFRTVFNNCGFNKTRFDKSVLNETEWHGSEINDCSFKEAALSKSIFNASKMRDCSLEMANMSRATVYKSEMQNCFLDNTRMSYFTFSKSLIDEQTLYSSHQIKHTPEVVQNNNEILAKCQSYAKDEGLAFCFKEKNRMSRNVK